MVDSKRGICDFISSFAKVREQWTPSRDSLSGLAQGVQRPAHKAATFQLQHRRSNVSLTIHGSIARSGNVNGHEVAIILLHMPQFLYDFDVLSRQS